MIGKGELEAYFAENVLGVDNLQFGCGMEPTIDARLADLIEMAASSNANPGNRFALQTNGLMLHQHDLERFKQAGLNLLSVSMDSTHSQTHRQLRGGSSVEKIIRNLRSFRSTCPEISLQILAVVTKLNIDDAESLAEFAIELGAKRMVYREMVYLPESQNIDHEQVRELIVPPGAFLAMRDRVLQQHEGKIQFSFLGTEHLKDYGKKSRANSYPQVSR
jgi:MoaA/NifB/PqqE/SkfB family radical SAM enzyme